MKMVRLILADDRVTPVYVNPCHVMSVEKAKDFTLLRMSGTDEKGEPLAYRVKESPEVVAHKLAVAAT